MAVAASLDERGRPWASLLTGPAGFIEAADEKQLRLAVAPAPDDPLAANLRARPELGLLVIDPRDRRPAPRRGQSLPSRSSWPDTRRASTGWPVG
jgi:predicted pyridoxine 5'-phosphate oxidase superfamily flavin-nucleotide-binding protein